MTRWLLVGQRGANSQINKWLSENPLVLGLIFLVIGVALAGSGVYELGKGVAHDKYGRAVRGGMGRFISIFRVVIGVGVAGFGLYKLVAG